LDAPKFNLGGKNALTDISLIVCCIISDDFKYLGTNLSSTNDNHEEIKKRMTSGNKCFLKIDGQK